MGVGEGMEIRFDEGVKQKLIFLVPFYSIEAWLYQNTEKLCVSSRREVQQLKEQYSELDYVSKIKDKTSFKSSRNHDLSSNIPITTIRSLELSLSETLAKINENEYFLKHIPKYGD